MAAPLGGEDNRVQPLEADGNVGTKPGSGHPCAEEEQVGVQDYLPRLPRQASNGPSNGHGPPASEPPAPIVLAHELPFRIGALELRPSTCEVISAEGNQTVQPRVMQVIVALARRRGEVVPHEDLLAECWPGRIVGDDAIHRCVAIIRRLGETSGSFIVENVSRVGYRLTPLDETTPALARPLRRYVLTAAILLGLAALAWFAFAGGSPFRPGGKGVEVMVMPFTAASANAEEAALATGITDELIVRMRRVPELKVVTGGALAPVGDSPAADHRVEGSVRLQKNGLRVSARLMDASGQVVWSQTFDRRISDLLQVQEDIARAVADELSVSLDVGIDSRSYGGTDNPEAFANYVQGSARLYDTDGSLGIAYLERAVELDPGYVKALAALSEAYGFSRNLVSSRREDQEWLRKQGLASARALRANPGIWQGHTARSYYELGRGNLAEAEAQYLRAVALDPGDDPAAKDTLASLASEFGLVRTMLEFRRSKAVIDPYYSSDSRLVGDLVLAGQQEEARALFATLPKETLAIHPGVAVDAFWAQLLAGDVEGARELAIRKKLFPPYGRVPDFQFDPADMPDPSVVDLRQWADAKFGEGGRADLVFLALLAAQNGKQAAALEYLRLAHRRTGAYGYRFLWHPALADVRRTEGFARLVNDLGLVAAWRKSGVWGDYCRPEPAGEITCR